jgi:anthranilate synthase/aminodeoxychorismate synthase-like glutamine amidotransferase
MTPFLFSMLLLVDNNDSFTYNIVELIRSVSSIPVVVIKSFDLSLDEVLNFKMIIFSPGPALPDNYPILKKIIAQYGASIPILGICLGHQAICEFFGAKLIQSNHVAHGIDSVIDTNPSSILFHRISKMTVGRYHSWYVTQIPDNLQVTAVDHFGMVMAVEHRQFPIFGVQFHPESYITKEGNQILKNFIDAATS